MIWNKIVANLFLVLQKMMFPLINQALNTLVIAPMKGMEIIFQNGLATLNQPTANPIVALATMGAYYINFVMALFLQQMALTVSIGIIPVVGPVIVGIVAMAMPLLVAWLGIMSAIGFATAYYVPMLPYMMFFFGVIAWLVTVIEAMVAAPIVALGVTHPEGHDAFGKGEAAVMILMNVFLRPSMMIIGYIAAIALTYVSVWLLNLGFSHAISYTQNAALFAAPPISAYMAPLPDGASMVGVPTVNSVNTGFGASDWTGFYAYFFAVLIYTTMYISVVSKAFSLIAMLPDKVLRWIGGQPESTGSEMAGMADDVKGAVSGAAKATEAGATGAMQKAVVGMTPAKKEKEEEEEEGPKTEGTPG